MPPVASRCACVSAIASIRLTEWSWSVRSGVTSMSRDTAPSTRSELSLRRECPCPRVPPLAPVPRKTSRQSVNEASERRADTEGEGGGDPTQNEGLRSRAPPRFLDEHALQRADDDEREGSETHTPAER